MNFKLLVAKLVLGVFLCVFAVSAGAAVMRVISDMISEPVLVLYFAGVLAAILLVVFVIVWCLAQITIAMNEREQDEKNKLVKD
jgi:predicted membrane protein